jgi:hypothetical protein
MLLVSRRTSLFYENFLCAREDKMWGTIMLEYGAACWLWCQVCGRCSDLNFEIRLFQSNSGSRTINTKSQNSFRYASCSYQYNGDDHNALRGVVHCLKRRANCRYIISSSEDEDHTTENALLLRMRNICAIAFSASAILIWTRHQCIGFWIISIISSVRVEATKE